ncbi:MAG: hypothetical protein WC693_02145 [Patescibacteria group bacterium]|jgi:hypothetical protein
MHSNIKIFIVAITVIIISGLTWVFISNDPKEESILNVSNANTDTVQHVYTNTAVEMLYKFTGLLTDISGGTGFGEAKANFENGEYNLSATFENLPDPEGTDYYEGWIVINAPQNFISTGKVIKENDVYQNTFSADQDLTDHDYFILTLEPDDGNPAPAVHILEGQLSS